MSNAVYTKVTDSQGKRILLTQSEINNLYAELWDSDGSINRLCRQAVDHEHQESAAQAKELLDSIVYKACFTYCAKSAAAIAACIHPTSVADMAHECFLSYLSLDLEQIVKTKDSPKAYIVRVLTQRRSQEYHKAHDFLPVMLKVTSKTRAQLKEQFAGGNECEDLAAAEAVRFRAVPLETTHDPNNENSRSTRRFKIPGNNGSEKAEVRDAIPDQNSDAGFNEVLSEESFQNILMQIPNPVVRILLSEKFAASDPAPIFRKPTKNNIFYDVCQNVYGISKEDADWYVKRGMDMLSYLYQKDPDNLPNTD